jgi:hypothetical protein
MEKQVKEVSFDEMTPEQQDSFFEKKAKEIKEEFKPLLVGLKDSETHTIILESGLGCILRNPHAGVMRKVMSKIVSMDGRSDIIGAGELIVDNCWVAGHNIIKENPDMKLSASMQAVGMINMVKGYLKKN